MNLQLTLVTVLKYRQKPSAGNSHQSCNISY